MLPEEQRIRSKQMLREWLDYELKRYPSGLSARLPVSEAAFLRRHQIMLRKTE